ncbi:gamma-glutamyl-gamma-aminobutyrate hydrolase family protein [Deefgea tanakiae]|uniref:Gamma-glutamyl-gamma-aminobutyrate hydrolase family protein n=1 Tax=Deefgea tanakiae TaxID=2865840 RepID=A0ABX8Z6E6_9NEIS|nr:gamma-glutamyl-gamma-aminobutyrate hydrolase family protein [Deefgea tanakiae]QZA77882.1 gamma-glutamyl-gamma-aminobutyrate hydrolase family protein [Deefgea tanakiae]
MSLPIIGIPCCRWKLESGHFYHLVGEKYIAAVVGAGGLPLLIPALGSIHAEHILAQVDGLLFTGSQSNIEPHHYGSPTLAEDFNDAERDATTLPLMRAAIAAGIPVLGLCRGAQEMNVAFGGTLHQQIQTLPNMLDHREPDGDIATMYGPAHEITLTPDGLLRQLYGHDRAWVNSLHQQGVKQLAAGLISEATAPDGLIEAFRLADTAAFNLAVQWHPEWQFQDNPLSIAIFNAFGAACLAHYQQRIQG